MADKWIERWQVIGTSGKPHVVARDRDNNFGCDCQAWIFKKGQKVDCQHILRIKLELMIPSTSQKQIKQIEKKNLPIRAIRLVD